MSERDDLLRRIEADLDGELDEAERARLEAALAADPSLAAEADELRRLHAVFRAVPPARAPAGFRDAVLDATVGADRAAEKARGGFRLLRVAPWIAGLAAALLLAVLLGPWDGGLAPNGSPIETADAPAAEPAEIHRLRELDDSIDAREDRSGPSGPRREAAEDSYAGEPAAPPEPPAGGRTAGEAVRKSVAVAEDQSAPEESPAPAKSLEQPSGPARPAPAAPDAGGAAAGESSRERTAAKDDAGGPAPPPAPPATPARDTVSVTAASEAAEAAGPGTPQDEKPPVSKPEATESLGRPTARRYVVFEDEKAAARYLASLTPAGGKARSAPEEKKAEGEGDEAADAGSGDRLNGARGLASRYGYVAAAPRVLGRVALLTTDPAVGRALARAPEGAVFGDSVPDELLQLAEERDKVARAATRRQDADSRASEPGAEDVPKADTAQPASGGGAGAGGPSVGGAGKGPTTGGGESGGPSVGGVAPGDASGPAAADDEQPSARVEIVVIVVAPGTLPPRPAGPR